VSFSHCFFYVGLSSSFVKFLEFLFHTFCYCETDRRVYLAVRLTGKFTSLEELTDDPNAVILLVLLADGTDFVGSERRVEPEGPM
jgi:hypothetical protein